MSQSRKLVKKGKTDSFVWKDDEVERLLWVTIQYKIAKTLENVDWESNQTSALAFWICLLCSIYLQNK